LALGEAIMTARHDLHKSFNIHKDQLKDSGKKVGKFFSSKAGDLRDAINYTDQCQERRPSLHISEAHYYSHAIVLKPCTEAEQLEILRRLHQAHLHLRILEPDDELHEGELCILAHAPQDLLFRERKKLGVENCIRSGLYIDAEKVDQDSRLERGGTKEEADKLQREPIANGAEVVLAQRIIQNALSEYKYEKKNVGPKVEGWDPVTVEGQKLPGLADFFPLHDEVSE
jgi:hypothetical protein